MGTKMQSETYFLRHSPRSLSRSISTGRWLSYQEGKVTGNSQHKESSSPWAGLVDRYSGHDKAKIKETILEHEATFRHQVRELHRIYRTQRELMNAIQDNRLYNFQKKAESSQSIISPSFVSSGRAKRARDGYPFFSSDSMIGQLDSSSSRAGQSPSTVLKRNNCESFNPYRGSYLHNAGNLRISGGGAHMNKEKAITEGLSLGLVGNGYGCEERTKEPLQERAQNSFFNSVGNYHNRAGDSESNVRSNGRNHLGYLNEPFQFLRNSSVKSSCHLSCHADNVSSGFSPLKETSQYSMPVMNGKNFLNGSPSGRDCNGKELKSCGSKFSTDLSLHIEHKTESGKKRKIFGVEIAEEVDQSNGVESNSSSFLSIRASASHLSRKVSSPQGSRGATTSEPSWLKLGSCLQNLDFVGGTDAHHALKSSVPKSELFRQSSICVHPRLNPELIDGDAGASLDNLNGKNAFNSLPDLFEYHDSSNCWKSANPKQMKSKKVLIFNSEITNMSENVSQQFFKITGTAEIPSKEFNLGKSIQDAEDKKDGHVIEKRVDAMDHPTEVVIQLEANPNAPESLSNYISGLKNHIDLNLSIIEEETPAAVVPPEADVKNTRPEIDLEIAAVIESDVDHGGTKSLVKSDEPHHYLIKEAAEALVVISTAVTTDVATYRLENKSSCLYWFADVICSYTSDEDGGIRETSKGIDGCYDDAFPDGMDFFEFMTLRLKGVKEETYCPSLSDMEHQKAAETEISAAKRRFGRGHRRGSRMKDFQKDVLPDLVSLAKQEVVEDLQTLEELFHSTGKTWKSSLSRRNRAKNGLRAMKPEANSALFPSKQKQTGRELQLRRRSLTGWGKRTRRLPRQRCSKKSCFSIQRSSSA